ncbi:uncharacterized protein LOC113350691 [Papaver somniferum]|uniref:uncharacterized protein LOC113350691 n=1 Tax=Papaver somniferum TaxID=3469 RepID=UPI000E7000D2|nr:uncharacterized protein LOC113350691 [Papaver somniferum]
MDKMHPASTLMIGRSSDVQKDPFRPKEDGEKVLGAEIPYLVYLKGTIDMGLFYPYEEVRKTASENATPFTETPNNVLVGFADAGYLSDPHKGRSQTGYVFTIGDTRYLGDRPSRLLWLSPRTTLRSLPYTRQFMKQGYIKGDNMKHISPKFFYNQQQQSLLKIQVSQVKSDENATGLFTKSLPRSTFEKHVKSIGLRKLSELP